MAEPYRKGEYVRYACNGVCLVDDIRLDVPAGKGTPKEFYILKPVSNPASTIFVPTGSPALVEKMARLPNREELDQLILSVKDHPLPWIEDRKARLASFQTIVKACDLRELICLVVCISRRKRSLLATGKKLGASDETLLQRAEGLIAKPSLFCSPGRGQPGGNLHPRKINVLTRSAQNNRSRPPFAAGTCYFIIGRDYFIKPHTSSAYRAGSGRGRSAMMRAWL